LGVAEALVVLLPLELVDDEPEELDKTPPSGFVLGTTVFELAAADLNPSNV
jgi:hypothetical protein